MTVTDNVENILIRAKMDNRKGNIRVYEHYKQQLELMCGSSQEYQDSCKKLADALRV